MTKEEVLQAIHKDIGLLTANVNSLLKVTESHDKRILKVEKFQYLLLGAFVVVEFLLKYGG